MSQSLRVLTFRKALPEHLIMSFRITPMSGVFLLLKLTQVFPEGSVQGAEKEEQLSTHNGDLTWEEEGGRAQWVHGGERGPTQPAHGAGG